MTDRFRLFEPKETGSKLGETPKANAWTDTGALVADDYLVRFISGRVGV